MLWIIKANFGKRKVSLVGRQWGHSDDLRFTCILKMKRRYIHQVLGFNKLANLRPEFLPQHHEAKILANKRGLYSYGFIGLWADRAEVEEYMSRRPRAEAA